MDEKLRGNWREIDLKFPDVVLDFSAARLVGWFDLVLGGRGTALSRLVSPKLLHRQIGKGRRPSNENQPVQAFDSCNESQRTLRMNITDTERGEGCDREVKVIERTAFRLASDVPKTVP
jgi:hypothetical protein